MHRPVNPAKHFEAEDIQGQIRKYAGCQNFTDDGKSCRSSFSTNTFINPTTKQRFNCNWYCLRNCSAQKLLPIFKSVPKNLILEEGKTMPVTETAFNFTLETSPPQILSISLFYSENDQTWSWSEVSLGRRIAPYVSGKELLPLAEKLCQWFKAQLSKTRIFFESMVYPSENYVTGFVNFDRPFLRPISEWNHVHAYREYFTTNFYLNSSSDILPEKMIIPQSSETSWKELPIGLTEPELEPSLIYHGVAHPDIHRISRKHRQVSRYRPRHFHSPTRKDVVGRKSKLAK
jgi:hypothetical protein